jgi:competence protein ComEC
MVNWQDPPEKRVVVLPGQRWRAALVLKRPHSAINPSGFDFEAHMFQKNIRAIGKVRGQPTLISDQPFFSIQVMVSRLRHHIRHAMRQVLGDARYTPVLIALAIGDQDSVSASDWDVFNRTGITHLVSISGSHVTMLAAFGGVSMLWFWKRIHLGRQHACERIPAKVMAAIAALCVALFYCLLAGWGVPARRTFFMLLVIGVAMISRYSMTPTTILSIAAAIVTLLDPWSPLSTGFWLSFGAVSVLFAAGAQAVGPGASTSKKMKVISVLRESARLQWLITLAMTPVIAFLFQQVSLSSPLANAIAIPVVTFIVTPLAILVALLCLIPGLEFFAGGLGWLANLAMQAAMHPITKVMRVDTMPTNKLLNRYRSNLSS